VSTAAGGVTPVSWAEALLADLGAPVTPNNIGTLTGWAGAEGGAGPQWGIPNNITNFNPLNVSLTSGPQGYGYDPGTGAYFPGSSPTPGNNPPIASFASWAQGLSATVDRLKEPFAAGILTDLQNNAPTGTTAQAVVASHWGTGLFSAGPSTGGGISPGTSPAAPAPTPTASTAANATTTGLDLNPLNGFGIPSWLFGQAESAASSWVAPLLQGVENAGLVFLGIILIVIGLVVLARRGEQGAQEHTAAEEERATGVAAPPPAAHEAYRSGHARGAAEATAAAASA
jgi:hypothetical protein